MANHKNISDQIIIRVYKKTKDFEQTRRDLGISASYLAKVLSKHGLI